MPEHQQTQRSTESKTTSQKQATPRIQAPSSHPMAIIQRARMNPKSLTHADVMQLQSTIGNRAVVRLLTEIGAIPSKAKQAPPVQRQELVQRQETPEEEEPLQGKMAETVQRQEIPEEEEPLQGKFENKPEIACPSCFAVPIVQRQEIPEEEEPLQGKMAEPIQRQEMQEKEEPLQGKIIEPIQRLEPEREEKLQMKSVMQRQEIPEEEEPLQGKMIDTVQRQEVPEEEPLQTKRENSTGMPDNLKAGVENLSGIDMSDVRVHYNSSKPSEVGALAYTQGTNIHVAPGQERHLPHEAWHVVQQAQRTVRPTIKIKDIMVNDNTELEREADEYGKLCMQQLAQQTANANISTISTRNHSPSSSKVAQLMLVRIRTKKSGGGNRVISEVEFEGRVSTTAKKKQGDHTVADYLPKLLLKESLQGKTHKEVASELLKLFELIDETTKIRVQSESGGMIEVDITTIMSQVDVYKASVEDPNAEGEDLNVILEEILDAYLRLWNKRAGAAYRRTEGKTTGGGGEKKAKKQLIEAGKIAKEMGGSEEVALSTVESILNSVDFVAKGPEDLKEAAEHLVTAIKCVVLAYGEIEENGSDIVYAVATEYAGKMGMPTWALDTLSDYMATLYYEEMDVDFETVLKSNKPASPAV